MSRTFPTWPALAVLAMLGCPTKTSYPGDSCDEYVRCFGELQCIGYRCVADCEYEGDCDRGYRCDDGHCLATCDEQEDCAGFGTCEELGSERRGKACMLTNLPECSEDFHCNGNICREGRCKQWCDHDAYCGAGQKCELLEDYRGYCVPDPDYVPPATNCADAPDPDQWCRDAYAGVTCDVATRTCTAPNVGFEIADVSYLTREDGLCSEHSMSPNAGSDIAAVQVLDAEGNLVELVLEEIAFGLSGANLDYDGSILNRAPFCQDTATSLGCGGSMILSTRDEAGDLRPLPVGGKIFISDHQAGCGLENNDRFDVTLCRDLTLAGLGIVCDGAKLAQSAGEGPSVVLPL